jgi:hypothetical protein
LIAATLEPWRKRNNVLRHKQSSVSLVFGIFLHEILPSDSSIAARFLRSAST